MNKTHVMTTLIMSGVLGLTACSGQPDAAAPAAAPAAAAAPADAMTPAAAPAQTPAAPAAGDKPNAAQGDGNKL